VDSYLDQDPDSNPDKLHLHYTIWIEFGYGSGSAVPCKQGSSVTHTRDHIASTSVTHTRDCIAAISVTHTRDIAATSVTHTRDGGGLGEVGTNYYHCHVICMRVCPQACLMLVEMANFHGGVGFAGSAEYPAVSTCCSHWPSDSA